MKLWPCISHSVVRKTNCQGLVPFIDVISPAFYINLFIVIFIYAELGPREIWRLSKESNGHQMTDLTFDPTRRTSAWGYMALEFWWIGFQVTFGQYFVQRIVACKTPREGSKALILGSILSWVIGAFMVSFLGVAALAYFKHCDPVESGMIDKYDATMPLLTTLVIQNYSAHFFKKRETECLMCIGTLCSLYDRQKQRNLV